jgi:glutamate N-acetyltransferase/amino-acid N-acetyltransferase
MKKQLVPKGFYSWVRSVGIKAGNNTPDLAVILSGLPAAAAAVFTKNDVVGEPIKIGQKHIRGGCLNAIVVNSKNANVATGAQGYQDALAMCQAVGKKFGTLTENVLPSSTGVIGVRLPIKKIIDGIWSMDEHYPPFDAQAVATAIMTTDQWPKFVSRRVGASSAVIAGVAKGAGMISPNMATMLAYFVTDANLSSSSLKRILKRAVDSSFNCISVDNDTSTSDTVAIMANGGAGYADERLFEKTLTEMCIYLAKEIVRNGEGVTKLITIRVTDAASESQAKIVADTIAQSYLVKTAIYGCDANWGRIIAAAGRAGQQINPENVVIYIGRKMVFKSGEPVAFSEGRLKEYLKGKQIEIRVHLGMGACAAQVWTGDLTEEYIRENASYRS